MPRKSTRDKVLRALFRLVGIGIFAVFLLKTDLGAVADLASKANGMWLAACLAIQFAMLALKAGRWWYYMRLIGMEIPLRRTMAIFFGGYFLGVITPGRAGEFVRVNYVRKEAGNNLALAFFSVLIDRSLDLVFFGLVGLGALAWLDIVPWYVFASALVVVLALAVPRLQRAVTVRLAGLAAKMLPKSWKTARSGQVGSDLARAAGGLQHPGAAWLYLLTIASNAGLFASVTCIAWALHLDVSYVLVSAGVALNGLLALLPITIAGLGTREAVFVYVFGLVGIGIEGVLAFTTTNILFIVVLPALCCLPFYLGLPSAARPEREATELQR